MMEEINKITREKVNENLKELLSQDDFTKVLEEIPTLKAQYDKAHRETYQEQLEAFLKTEIEEIDPLDGEKKMVFPKEADFKFTPDVHSHRFKELYESFLEQKKEFKKKIAQQEEENFEAKSQVIEGLKKLTEEEFHNFGEMFAHFKTLQEKWKAVGDVNKARFQTLQTEYSHLVDKFFYNVNIHKSLQNYSFEKNSEQKKKIVAKLKELKNNDSIIQLEHYIKQFQKEWDEIGPTFQEEWEKIKEEYWSNVNEVYAKIRDHYLKIREKQKESIEQKEKLIAEAKLKFEELKEATNPKEWNDLSNKLKEMQQAWKKTGFSKKAKDQELWESFREVSNQFFAHTKDLYDKLNEKRDVFEEKKLALIAKAEELKDSKEWKFTTEKLIELQNQWKKSGSLRPQKDHKLWNKFRGACNTFFDNKKEYFSTLDERQEENLKNKEAIAKAIEEVKNKEELIAKIEEWWAVGHVPKKAINSSTSKLNNAISAVCKTLAIEKDVKDNIVFEAKIKAFKNADNAENLIKAEKRFVKERMDKIREEINQYENNLGFFGPSKGAQKLKEIVEKKINEAKEKLQSWENKAKLLK